MTDSYTLRAARIEDAAPLAALKRACFTETFGPTGFAIPYPEADRIAFEDANYSPEPVAREIADTTHRTWVVEDSAGELVGYCHVGPGKLPHPDFREGDSELYQLYLLRRAQGAGLGRQLLDVGLDYLEGLDRPIWLGVWSLNLRAQAVYKARGFAIVGEYQFKVGDWRDDEFIMRKG